MTISLMSYGIVVGVLIATCAQAVQSLGRLIGAPVRWVWAGAILLTLSLIVVAPYRNASPFDSATTRTAATLASIPSAIPVHSSIPARIADAAQRALVLPIERAIAAVENRFAQSGSYLIALWLCVSSLLALVMIAVHARMSRARQRWPRAVLRDVPVRVAPGIGPAVIGITRAEIIVPRWLLARGASEQDLVLAHETEHLTARDPMLLAAAWAATVLVPWNPAAWLMLARLRLAVELDCDARVLRRGVAPRAYGTLLIDLAAQCSGFRVGVPALADDSSHLRQRLIAMKQDKLRFAGARAVSIGLIALTSLIIACETSLPTADDVSQMDATSAELAARKGAMLQRSDTAPVFTVDGAVVSEEVAREVSPEEIASIQVVKPTDGKQAQIRISKRLPGLASAVTDSTRIRTRSPQSTIVQEAEGRAAARTRNPMRKFSGVYLLNGKPVDQATVEALDPKAIKSIEIVKGSAAAKLSTDPLGVNGVISISTH